MRACKGFDKERRRKDSKEGKGDNETKLSNCLERMGSLSLDNLEGSDVAIVETSEESGVGLVPGEGQTSNGLFHVLEVCVDWLDSQVCDELAVGEIPDLDTLISSNDKPVLLGAETKAVDGCISVDLSKILSFDEVPQDGGAIARSRCHVRGVGGNVDGSDLVLVADKGVHQLHRVVVPDLDGLVIRGAHDERY